MKSMKDFLNESVTDQSSFYLKLDLSSAEKNISTVIKSIIGMDPQVKLGIGKIRGVDSVKITSSKDFSKDIKFKLFKSLKLEGSSYGLRDDGNCALIVSYKWESFHGASNGQDIALIILDVSGKVVKYRNDFN